MAAKRRILHAVGLDTIGGVEHSFRFYLEHSTSLGRLEHHVLVTGGRCHPHIRGPVRASARTVSFAKYWHGLKVPKWPRVLRWRNQALTFRRVKPDVVLLWNCIGNVGLAEAAAEAVGAAKVYYERGGAWLVRSKEEATQFLEQVDGVLCNSHASRRVMELRWGYRGWIGVCVNALRPDLRLESPVPKKLRASSGTRLGTAARMVPLKGLCLALHAVRKLIDRGEPCELHLAGVGPEEGRLRALAKELGIDASVRFHGCLSDMRSFYEAIDILLCPSIREPFGLVCVEAGALGCVVVASCVDGVPEVVQHGETGYCVQPTLPLSDYPGLGASLDGLPEFVYDPVSDSLMEPKLLDPECIANAVAELLDDPTGFEDMSAAAQRQAASRFHFGEHVNCVDDCLTHFAEARG